MSVNHSDIFEVARHLLSQQESDGVCCEANLRSAASRAYYAVLHATLQAIPEEFSPEDRELNAKDSHNVIIGAMVAWGNSVTPGRSEAKIISRELPRLKRLRKTADYAIDSDFSAAEASEAIARANRIFDNIKIACGKCNPLQTA